ncbi:MAG: DUF4019 domain-containing protein [Proteobacteria bacterium]|nr:DUF4019 domain-containing protein [Pseudomonadota bacterium]
MPIELEVNAIKIKMVVVKKGGSKMKFKIFVCIVGVMLISSGCSKKPAGNPAAEAAAVSAAQVWLGLTDGGQYGESWEEAAGYFKKAITKEKWEEAMNAARVPLGAMVSRSVSSKQYMTSVPGAPDGEYVMVQFKTSFANKASAVETVTPMLDKDGKWRISGYYIK